MDLYRKTNKSQKQKLIQHVWRVPPWTTHLVGGQTPPGASVKHRYNVRVTHPWWLGECSEQWVWV